MSVRKPLGHYAALRYLADHAGRARVLLLCMLVAASSVSEGIGLLLLVPVTHLIAGEGELAQAPQWLAGFASFSPAALLAGVVIIVSLRAALVYATNEYRRSLDLSLTRKLRLQAHHAVVRAEWRWLSGRNSGEHGALIMGEAERAGSLVDQAIFIASTVLTLFFLFVSAFLIMPQFAMLMIGLGMLAAAPLVALRNRVREEAEAYSDAYAHLHLLVSNGLDHLRAARISGAIDSLEQRFEETSETVRDLEISYFRQGHRMAVTLQIVAAVFLAVLIYFALIVGNIALALFLPLLVLLARAAPLMGTLIQSVRNWNHAIPALNRLRALIEVSQQNREQAADTPPQATVEFSQSIRLQDVSLYFDGRSQPVLDRFSLQIDKGSVVAITGPSGTGKSSIADLLSGLITPSSGSVVLDGEVLDGDRRIAWRDQIAYAEQEPYFFDGTLLENLTWSRRDADDAQIAWALDAASASFVHDLPNRLETQVGEAGVQISGGERQRLALARALLRQPQLLILDEVTSALDRQNRAAIAGSIDRLRGDCTIVLLSHDEALIRLADKVVDLGGGRRE